MKTLIIALPLIFLFALQLQAQGPQTLSFTISDTLKVEASTIELRISHYTFHKDSPSTNVEGMGPKISFEELKKFCAPYKIKQLIEPRGQQEFDPNGYRERVIILEFSSRKEMLDCFIEVSKFAHVLPQVQALNLEEEASHHNEIFLQTLEKGKAKARSYATSLGKKISKLTSIEEKGIHKIKDEDLERNLAGGWTIYPPLSALTPENIPINTKVPIICTLKLTFELE